MSFHVANVAMLVMNKFNKLSQRQQTASEYFITLAVLKCAAMDFAFEVACVVKKYDFNFTQELKKEYFVNNMLQNVLKIVIHRFS